jgi:hypothetical protein
MCSVTAFATELTDNQCNLTICIIDYMGGSFQEDITVHFKSESTGHDFTTVVTQSEYLINGSVAASVPMGDTYDISFSFKSDSKNLVAIREGDGTEIKSFTPDSTEHTFEWGLVSTQDLQSTSTNTEGTKSLTTIDTGNEEADEMFNEYTQKAAEMFDESNSTFEVVRVFCERQDSINEQSYLKNYTGGTEEKWNAMTPLEKFLTTNLYVIQVEIAKSASSGGDLNIAYGSVDVYNSHVIGDMSSIIARCKDDSQVTAFQEIADWQYNYYIKTGSFYDFTTGMTSEQVDTSSTSNSDDTDENTIKEAQSELNGTSDNSQSNGVWNETKSEIKGIWFTIVVLIVLVGGLIGVIIYRKKKNIDLDGNIDDGESDNNNK